MVEASAEDCVGVLFLPSELGGGNVCIGKGEVPLDGLSVFPAAQGDCGTVCHHDDFAGQMF